MRIGVLGKRPGDRRGRFHRKERRCPILFSPRSSPEAAIFAARAVCTALVHRLARHWRAVAGAGASEARRCWIPATTGAWHADRSTPRHEVATARLPKGETTCSANVLQPPPAGASFLPSPSLALAALAAPAAAGPRRRPAGRRWRLRRRLGDRVPRGRRAHRQRGGRDPGRAGFPQHRKSHGRGRSTLSRCRKPLRSPASACG